MSPARVELHHVNPVQDFYAYNPAERCFVDKGEIDFTKPHPAFDVMFRVTDEPKEVKRARGMFYRTESPALFHPTLNRLCGAGGRISACLAHRVELEQLRQKFYEDRAITSAAIRAAKMAEVID